MATAKSSTATGITRPMSEWKTQQQSGAKSSADRLVSLEELKLHDKRDDAWIALKGKVFDITDYIDYHPGGLVILKGVGQDSTALFNQVHPHVNFEKLLSNKQVGVLPSGNSLSASGGRGSNKKPGGGPLCSCCKRSGVGNDNTPATVFQENTNSVTYQVSCPVQMNNVEPDQWSVVIIDRQQLLVKFIMKPPDVWISYTKLTDKFDSEPKLTCSTENMNKTLTITFPKPRPLKWKSLGSPLSAHNSTMSSMAAPRDYYPATVLLKQSLGMGQILFAIHNGPGARFGVPIGWHLRLKIGDVDRPYTPVRFVTRNQTSTYESLTETYGGAKGQVFFFVIKIVKGGSMSTLLDKIPQNKLGAIEIGCATGKFDTSFLQDVDRLIIVAGGTGVAPFTGIMKLVKEQRKMFKIKQVAMVVYSKTKSSVVWHEAWEALAKSDWFFYMYFLTQSKASISGKQGRPEIQKLDDFFEKLPRVGKTAVVKALACGPPGFTANIEKIFKTMGVKEENVYMFEG